MGYESNMKEFTTEFNTWQEKALKAIGIFGESEAKLRSAVDTGNLRSSIAHKVDKKELATYLGSNVEYALFVEKGTVKMKAQPFLTPAIESNTKKIESLVNKIKFAGGNNGAD